jgi:hypothetical protein
MIAKLRACERALTGADGGADDVAIVDGRDRDTLMSAAAGDGPVRGTRITAGVAGLKSA